MSIDKLISNKILYPLLGMVIIGLSTFCWNLNGRLSMLESQKKEIESIVRIHDEDKSVLHKRINKEHDRMSELIRLVDKNTNAREYLHKDN